MALNVLVANVESPSSRKHPDGPLPEGHIVGRYRVERVLGVGGQAAVYLGRHCRLSNQIAAIKVPRGETTSRMLREADVMARLDHPGILRVRDVDADSDPPYLVLDYCAGGSLAERVMAEGPLPLDEVVRISNAVLEALAFAHGQGVIHRDLKPQNVLFDSEGNPLIADFGLGKVVAEQISLSLSQGTRTGTVGTPAFMAPEQEVPGGPVDERADLYAIGKLIYAMLTAQDPRTLRPVEQVREDAGSEWSDFVYKLTAPDPADRPDSATEVLEELNRIHPLQEQGRVRLRPRLLPRSPCRKKRGVAGRAGRVVAGIFATLGFVFTFLTSLAGTLCAVNSVPDEVFVSLFIISGFTLVGSIILTAVAASGWKGQARRDR